MNEERTFNLATAALKDGNTWEQDKVYNYIFNITLDMITFDAVVDNWSETVNSEISVMSQSIVLLYRQTGDTAEP